MNLAGMKFRIEMIPGDEMKQEMLAMLATISGDGPVVSGSQIMTLDQAFEFFQNLKSLQSLKTSS